MTIPLDELKLEITLDPEGLGYGNSDLTDASDADKLNAMRESVTLPRVVNGDDLAGAIDLDEFVLLAPAQQQWIVMQCRRASVKIVNPVRSGFTSLFPPTSRTRQAMARLIEDRRASRAEFLFGEGARVSPSDVAEARSLP